MLRPLCSLLFYSCCNIFLQWFAAESLLKFEVLKAAHTFREFVEQQLGYSSLTATE